MALAPVSATLLLLSSIVAAAPSGTASAEAVEVRVPIPCGRRFLVSQAHATGSHLHYDTHAWDFRMPEGEPVVAAKDGVVRLARGDSKTGGCGIEYAKDANYVVIDHGQGVETQYLHFWKVVVKPGDAVKAGQLIGYSGKTGWACGAHLHFKVARTQGPGWNNPSVPATLVGHGDPQAGDAVHGGRCGADEPYLASLPPSEEPAQGALAIVEAVEKKPADATAQQGGAGQSASGK